MAGISDDIENLRVNMNDFNNALEEVHPAFGVAEEELAQVIQNGIIHFDKSVDSILRDGQLFVEQVRTSSRTPLVSLLFHGPPGAGKTAMAATIAQASGFPFIKLVSADAMVGFSEGQKIAAITKVFQDSYKSPLSVVVVDNIERLLDWVPIGPRFSNGVLQALMVLMAKRPPAGKRLLVIATTSIRPMLTDMQMSEVFDAELRISPISTLSALSKVLVDMQLFRSREEHEDALNQLQIAGFGAEGKLNIGVKKFLSIVEMARQEPHDIAQRLAGPTLARPHQSLDFAPSYSAPAAHTYTRETYFCALHNLTPADSEMATVAQQHFDIAPSDLEFLEKLTSSVDLSSVPRQGRAFSRREAPLDPLLFAAATASGPHVTRHHYHHDFFPIDEEAENPLVGSYARCDANDDAEPRYISRQKPRRERLRELGVTEDGQAAVGPPKEDNKLVDSPAPVPVPELRSPAKSRRRRSSLLPSADPTPAIELLQLPNPPMSASQPLLSKSSSRDPVVVQCRARTRIPTPHGPAFLHIYHNNRDAKEHLAVVIDPAQLDQADHPTPLPPIRSTSLDAVWREGETETERIVRGAYVGRLSSTAANPSSPTSSRREYPADAPAPLVRIHSECFTGETIGSMRCDCGEQLDEAMRLIAQPVRIPSTGEVVPGRGAI
ncbi:transport between ER and Golgi ATPase protein, partial [Ceratobasidium sp. 392]